MVEFCRVFVMFFVRFCLICRRQHDFHFIQQKFVEVVWCCIKFHYIMGTCISYPWNILIYFSRCTTSDMGNIGLHSQAAHCIESVYGVFKNVIKTHARYDAVDSSQMENTLNGTKKERKIQKKKRKLLDLHNTFDTDDPHIFIKYSQTMQMKWIFHHCYDIPMLCTIKLDLFHSKLCGCNNNKE